mgnify:CR=1 FL=1
MKTFKLFARYIKKYIWLFILTVILVVGLNYIRSIVPKLTSTFIAIVEGKPLIDSETPTFLLPLFNGAESIPSQLLVTALIIIAVAFVREIINIHIDFNIVFILVKSTTKRIRIIIIACKRIFTNSFLLNFS